MEIILLSSTKYKIYPNDFVISTAKLTESCKNLKRIWLYESRKSLELKSVFRICNSIVSSTIWKKVMQEWIKIARVLVLFGVFVELTSVGFFFCFLFFCVFHNLYEKSYSFQFMKFMKKLFQSQKTKKKGRKSYSEQIIVTFSALCYLIITNAFTLSKSKIFSAYHKLWSTKFNSVILP